MEFEKINLEKSWNFVSDLKLSESNFSRATRAFQVPIVTPTCTFSLLSLYLYYMNKPVKPLAESNVTDSARFLRLLIDSHHVM